MAFSLTLSKHKTLQHAHFEEQLQVNCFLLPCFNQVYLHRANSNFFRKKTLTFCEIQVFCFTCLKTIAWFSLLIRVWNGVCVICLISRICFKLPNGFCIWSISNIVTSKPFRRAGFTSIYYLSNLSLSFCWCKRCCKCERKEIGMLRIENYKNKSNMEINKKQWQK